MSEPRPRYGETGRITKNLATNRQAANEESRLAAERIEKSLAEALGGERLYAAPNLGTANAPLYGYRIRCKEEDRPLSWRGKPALILSAEGKLAIAWRAHDAGLGWRDAIPEDYRAEDLPRILEVVDLALKRHLAKAERRSNRFKNIRELADKINFLLGE